MSSKKNTLGQVFYDRQVACLEAQDIEGLMAQYHEDAILVGFDTTVHGREAIGAHLREYLKGLGELKLLSTDKFTETDDAIFFEATVQTRYAEAKVYDVFILRDGKATHQFTGLISAKPLHFPT